MPAEHGHDVLDRNNVQLVVGLKIDGDRVLGVKQDLVVLPQRNVLVVLDLGRDGDDASGDRGNLGMIGQSDASLGLAFGFVLADQNAGPDGFDVFEGFLLGFRLGLRLPG